MSRANPGLNLKNCSAVVRLIRHHLCGHIVNQFDGLPAVLVEADKAFYL